MTEFFQALANPEIAFLRNSLLAGLCSCLAFGIFGSLIVVRRMTVLAGAISHSSLGGIGLALYLQTVHSLAWFSPFLGGILAALLSAFFISWISTRHKEREDSAISATWVIGMAIGILFLYKTPRYVDPNSYLFGDLLLTSPTDLILILTLDLLIAAVGIWYYHQFVALCFDAEFAQIRGVPVAFLNHLLLAVSSLTIVLLIPIVGVVLVLALITLPAAIAGFFAKKMWHLMAISTLSSMLFIFIGMWLSYTLDLPPGPVIILLAAKVYLILLFSKPKTVN